MSSKAKRTAAADTIVTPDVQEILTIDQIVDRYRGEWILLQVTENKGDWPEAGIVIIRGPTRDSVQEPMLTILREARRTGPRYYLFRAIPLYRSWDEWRATLDENWRPRRSGGRRER